jgi:hypothetical protein
MDAGLQDRRTGCSSHRGDAAEIERGHGRLTVTEGIGGSMFRRRRRRMRGAAVAGGAYSAGGHTVNERDAAAAAEIEKLERLRDQGDLTDDEFEARKANVLAP